jgi:subtilase family serine protease
MMTSNRLAGIRQLGRGVPLAALLAGAIGLAAGAVLTAYAGSAPERRALPRYVPLWSIPIAGGGSATADLGLAAPDAPVGARVYLAGKNPGGLAARAAAASDPSSPLFHDYLTPAEAQERFGPSAGQVASVERWLAGSGLQVAGVTAHDVAVTGTAAQAEAAFGAPWHSYLVNGRTQQAPAPDASLTAPEEVARAVLTIVPAEIGLPGLGPPAPQRPSVMVQPCSTSFGQDPATGLPPAYGSTAPYVACGYSPQQLRSAYGVPDDVTGEGVTVAVVRPWRELTAAQDLATFGARHGEPLRPGQFTEILPASLDASCPNGIRAGNSAVNVEEIPDVEAVHAMAPAARIDYLGARCDDDLGTLSGLDALTEVTDRHLASIVSNSWLPAPFSPGLAAAFEQVWQQGAVEGIGFYFGSGLNFPFGNFTARFPAADPWVTAVGGTTLAIGPSGNYEWETGWGDDAAALTAGGTGWANPPGRFVLGSGGGASTQFAQPAYQRGVVPTSLSLAGGSATPMRVIPDIAADADFATPVLSGATESIGGEPARYTEFPSGGAISIALVAGMQADAQQAARTPIGFANPAIYARFGSTAYHDVTDDPFGPGVRLDAVVPAGAQLPNVAPTPALLTFGLDRGLAATPGYDLVTGVGTPTSAYFASFRRQ